MRDMYRHTIPSVNYSQSNELVGNDVKNKMLTRNVVKLGSDLYLALTNYRIALTNHGLSPTDILFNILENAYTVKN